MTIKEFRAQWALGALLYIPYSLNPFKRLYFLRAVTKKMDNILSKDRLNGKKRTCIWNILQIVMNIVFITMAFREMFPIEYSIFIIAPFVTYIFERFLTNRDDIVIQSDWEIYEWNIIKPAIIASIEQSKIDAEEKGPIMKLTLKQIRERAQNGLFKKQKS